jgi:hypothetical protein
MRPSRLLPLAVLALAATACGSAGAGGSSTERVVKGDWEFNHAFTGRDAVYADYDAVDHIDCDGRPDAAGDVNCRLEVSSSKLDGRKREARVVVHYDQQGILQGWDLLPPAGEDG